MAASCNKHGEEAYVNYIFLNAAILRILNATIEYVVQSVSENVMGSCCVQYFLEHQKVCVKT